MSRPRKAKTKVEQGDGKQRLLTAVTQNRAFSQRRECNELPQKMFGKDTQYRGQPELQTINKLKVAGQAKSQETVETIEKYIHMEHPIDPLLEQTTK